MTPKKNWSNVESDDVKPISSFHVSNVEDLKEAFDQKNTKPSLGLVHLHKWSTFNFLNYRLQLEKAYQSLKLNDEEEYVKTFMSEKYSKPF